MRSATPAFYSKVPMSTRLLTSIRPRHLRLVRRGAFLTSAQLGINSGGPGPATGPIDVILAADAAGLPGAGLQHSIVNVTTNGNQVISAGFPGTLLLAANTKYWVIADAEGTFDGGWNFNTTGDTGPTAGQTEGGPWSLHSPEQRFAFRVQGRLVPEPASLTLVAGGLIGTVAHRRRRVSAQCAT